jgi:flagellar hook-length control protein FliK
LIIQGGNSYSNKQAARATRSTDAASFDDFIANTSNKKKEHLKELSESIDKKKDNKDKSLNSQGQAEPQKSPVNKQDKLDAKTEKVDTNKENLDNRKIENTKQANNNTNINENNNEQVAVTDKSVATKSDVKSDSGQLDISLLQNKDFDANQVSETKVPKNLENALNQKVGDENPLLSLNLSAVDNKTLEKNKNIIADFENQLSQLVQEQNQNQNQNLNPEVTSQQTNLGLVQNIKGQEAPAKFTSNIANVSEENSLSALESQLKALVLENSDNKDSLLEDDKTDFNSLLTQGSDQDQKIAGSEQNIFTDELNQIGVEGNAEKIENMQSIIKDAKAMIDDGGGTMEIHLQPEGLGKVHLKVAVQNGQVNVEMQTDNLEAKRALEEGLFEIKNALEGQKLLVETLKVEMAPDYQKDFSDMRDHMQEQANRDFAEQFLGQFRQEREDRLGGLFDGFRNFQKKSDEPNLVLNQRNPYTQNGKGRTLNVVA